jgi:DNA-binding CsgD family transcriptional regulator
VPIPGTWDCAGGRYHRLVATRLPSPHALGRLDCQLREAQDLHAFAATLAQELARYVPFDHLCFGQLDPETHYVTSKFDFGGPAGDPRLVLENEYTEADFCKFSALAEAEQVAALSLATDGEPSRSPRFRAVLAPSGFGDEARIALSVRGELWGFVEVLRSEAAPSFKSSELAALAGLAPTLSGAVRRLATRPFEDTEVAAHPMPGVLLVAEDGELLSASAGAEQLLARLGASRHLPAAVEMVLVAARSCDEGSGARARVRSSTGKWLTIGATYLPSADGAGRYAVVLDSSQPSELASLLFRAYGLTEREAEVATAVWRHLSTEEIASELFISAYTVQDHLKTIFQKVGVRSRRELLAALWQERMQTAAAPSGLGPHADP